MDKQKFAHLLDQVAARQLDPDTDLLPALEQQLAAGAVPTRTSRRRLRRSPAARLMLAACLLLIVSTVYAVLQLKIDDPGLRDSMVTELNLTQTVDDETATLNWAYADANRIVIAYTFTRQDGTIPDDQVVEVELRDSEGHAFQPVAAFGLDRAAPEMLHGSAHYDASVIEGTPAALDLTLRLARRFTFEFRVPFIPGVRVEDGTVQDRGGLDASLEWVVVAPSMTRVYFCYRQPEIKSADGAETWYPRYPGVLLEFDGVRVAREAGASYTMNSPTQDERGLWCQETRFLTTYQTIPQQVTLTITHLQTRILYSEDNMRRAAGVFAGYGITAEVRPNVSGGYLLNFPEPVQDYARFEQIWSEAQAKMGEPLSGKRLDGPWTLTVDLPEAG